MLLIEFIQYRQGFLHGMLAALQNAHIAFQFIIPEIVIRVGDSVLYLGIKVFDIAEVQNADMNRLHRQSGRNAVWLVTVFFCGTQNHFPLFAAEAGLGIKSTADGGNRNAKLLCKGIDCNLVFRHFALLVRDFG